MLWLFVMMHINFHVLVFNMGVIVWGGVVWLLTNEVSPLVAWSLTVVMGLLVVLSSEVVRIRGMVVVLQLALIVVLHLGTVVVAVILHVSLDGLMLMLIVAIVVGVRVVWVGDLMGSADLPVIGMVNVLQVVMIDDHITMLVLVIAVVMVNVLLLVVGKELLVLVLITLAVEVRVDESVMHGRDLDLISDLVRVMMVPSVQRFSLEMAAHPVNVMVGVKIGLSEVVLMIRLHLQHEIAIFSVHVRRVEDA